MRKALTLLAVTMLTAASAGCNCCPCLRNLCPFGACSSLCQPSPPPVATYAAVPACAPACSAAPVYAAAPAMPVYATPQQYTVPQYAAPQYAVAAPQPVYSEAGCGSSYAAAEASPCGVTCGGPCGGTCGGACYSAADPSCCCTDVGYGGAPAAAPQVMVDPAPAP